MYGPSSRISRRKGRATYAEIAGPSGKLARLEPFEGHSMSATWEGDSYCVYSYSTLIGYVHDGVAVAVISPVRYSTSNGYHAMLCRSWLPAGPEYAHAVRFRL